MLHTKRLLALFLLVLPISLSGCACGQDKQMTPTPRPIAVAVDEVTSSPAPSPIPSTTPCPTATTRPSDTPTATGTPTIPPPTNTPAPTATATTAPTLRIAILEFKAEPESIAPGEPITLTWRVDAEWSNIRTLDSGGRLVEPPLTSELAGVLRVEPDPDLWNLVQFTLYAGVGGRFERRDLAVAVRCIENWAFDGPPPGCPSRARTTTFVAQQFERGLMLWLEPTEEHGPTGDIIILYADTGGTVAWEIVPDGFQEGMVESDPDIVPPGDLLQPVRGFGNAWREQPGVRDRLGWALEREYVMGTGVLQCSRGKYATCYVNGPHGDVYVLHPWGSSWELWLGTSSTP